MSLAVLEPKLVTKQNGRFGGRFDEHELAEGLNRSVLALHAIATAVGAELSTLREEIRPPQQSVDSSLRNVSNRSSAETDLTDVSVSQRQILLGAIPQLVVRITDAATRIGKTVSVTALREGCSSRLEELPEKIADLRGRALRYVAEVMKVDLPGDEYHSVRNSSGFYRSTENPLRNEQNEIFQELHNLIDYLRDGVAELHQSILKFHIEVLDATAAGERRQRPSLEEPIKAIKDGLGSTKWQAGDGYVPRALAFTRQELRVACAFLESVARLVDSYQPEAMPGYAYGPPLGRWSFEVVALDCVRVSASLACVTGDLDLVLRAMESDSAPVAQHATEQLGYFIGTTNIRDVTGDAAFFDKQPTQEYRTRQVLQAREQLLNKFSDKARSADDPRQFVARIRWFGIEGVPVLCAMLQQQTAISPLGRACVEELTVFLRDVSTRGLSHLAGKAQPYRDLYSDLLSGVRTALVDYKVRVNEDEVSAAIDELVALLDASVTTIADLSRQHAARRAADTSAGQRSD